MENIIIESFVDYKNNILNEIIFANYYLSSKDALDHIQLFTNILYEYYEKEIPVNEVLTLIMTYDASFK